jgi:hypothetical protein
VVRGSLFLIGVPLRRQLLVLSINFEHERAGIETSCNRIRESQVCIQSATVADPVPPDNQIASLLRQLDDLVSEAERLREDIQRAMTREARIPFWPERRCRKMPVPQDRRQPERDPT